MDNNYDNWFINKAVAAKSGGFIIEDFLFLITVLVKKETLLFSS